MEPTIRPLAHAMGAEVIGVDGTKPPSQALLRTLREAWLRHQVLVFRDMEISPAQHVAFSRAFGELELHPVPAARSREHPEIMEVTNRVQDGVPSPTAETGRMWHSDGAFTDRPPTGSLLHCRARPSVGGDTWFTNMVMAYESLSDGMKRMLEPLSVVNSIHKHQKRTRDPNQTEEESRRRLPPVVQPLVLAHPETGRKALYLSEMVTTQVLGMTVEESEGLLHYLFAHCAKPEFTYRHVWRLHDIVMWDNRCTMHLAPADYDRREIRHMSRTTLVGAPQGRIHHEGAQQPA